MKTEKLKFPFAAITVLCWFLFTSYNIYDLFTLLRGEGLSTEFILKTYGLIWIPAAVSLFLLTLVVLSRTRSILLPLTILLQLSMLAEYVYTYFIEQDIDYLLDNLYPENIVYTNTVCSAAFAAFIFFTFLFSLFCLSGRHKVVSAVFFIIYLILFVIFAAVNIACAKILEYVQNDYINMSLMLISYFFLGIWIAFPYKYKHSGSDHKHSKELRYRNDGANHQYAQPQDRYDPYGSFSQYPQDLQQYEQTDQFNYPTGQSSFDPAENSRRNTRTCPVCGSPLKDDDVFCGICGTKCN